MSLFVRATVCFLIVWSAVIYGYGFSQSWLRDSDCDLQQRQEEYESFRQGVYPTRTLEPGIPKDARVPYTVYPPYALPMFMPLYEPFGKLQGRVVIQLLSLAGLAAIAAYGTRLLRPAGTASAILGALAAVAIPGNGSAIAVGQFSIICAASVLAQMNLLDRGRPLAAGACWALAMLKPQIGLSFAALFFVRREWLGLAWGVTILLGLSLVACWWTEVSPWAVVDHWMLRMYTGFASSTSVSGQFAEAIEVNPRIIHITAAALLVMIPIVAIRIMRRSSQADTLNVAAVAALCSSVLIYHRAYDRIMMFPVLFVALAATAQRPTPWHIFISVTLALSLWLPEKIIPEIPLLFLVRPAVWVALGIAMFMSQRRSAATKYDVQPHSTDSA